MITKVIFIFTLIILQNIFLINPVSTAQKYIEVDKIVAIVETQTITNSELNKKKEGIKKALFQQGENVPSDKKITKLSLDQLITEKLVTEYALIKGIEINDERLNNVINGPPHCTPPHSAEQRVTTKHKVLTEFCWRGVNEGCAACIW